MADYDISFEDTNAGIVGRLALPAGHPWRTKAPPHVGHVDGEGRVTFAWRFRSAWGPSSEGQARAILEAAVAEARAVAGPRRPSRAELAEEAYFSADAPDPVSWARVVSMLRCPTAWTRTGLEETATLLRQWRAYELCRLAYLRMWGVDEVASTESKARLDGYRDAERSLRGILARLGLVRRALPGLTEQQHAAIAAALPAGGNVTGEAWRRRLIDGLYAASMVDGRRDESLHALVCLVEGP